MTVDKFIKEQINSDIVFKNIGAIPNKRLVKLIKSYKYIEITNHWYDDYEEPDSLTWIDVEGIDYGWIWLNYRKERSHNKLKKRLRKIAVARHTNEDVYTAEANGVKFYIWSLSTKIIVIRLSDNELNELDLI